MIKWATDPTFLRNWTDQQLVDAWRRGDGEPDSPECYAIAIELQRRGLDFERLA